MTRIQVQVPIYLLHSEGDLLCEVSASKHFQSLHTNKLSKFVYTEQGKHELLQEASLWKVFSLPTRTRASFVKSYSFSEFPFRSDLLDGLPSPPRLVAYLVAHSSHCRSDVCKRKKSSFILSLRARIVYERVCSTNIMLHCTFQVPFSQICISTS